MDDNQLDQLLKRHSETISDEEVLDSLRPEVREQLRVFAMAKVQSTSQGRRRWVLALVPLGVAAAACLVWLLLPQRTALQFTVAIAPETVAPTTRGGEAPAEPSTFRVDVATELPCWIHLIERTAAGELVVAHPTAASKGYAVKVDGRASLGPFHWVEPNAPSGPSRVTHLIVVASPDPVTGDVLASAVPDLLAAGGSEAEIENALTTCAQNLSHQQGWSVTAVRVPAAMNVPETNEP